MKTNAIGIKATTGRYGGTYAQSDIAYEFAYEFSYWISVGGGKWYGDMDCNRSGYFMCMVCVIRE